MARWTRQQATRPDSGRPSAAAEMEAKGEEDEEEEEEEEEEPIFAGTLVAEAQGEAPCFVYNSDPACPSC